MAKLTLFHNARVYTVDPRWPEAAWFTTLGGTFQRVGAGPRPEIKDTVDLGGRFVVPGFVDAHAHFFQTGIDLLQIDASRARSIAELRPLLLDQAPRRGWIFANRFEEERLQDVDRLTREHLDDIHAERPIWVNRVDYHSAVVNSTGLRRLAVPRDTPGLLTDAGEPNGILRADAYFYAKRRVSQLYSIELKEKAIRAACAEMLRNGVTAVHALEGGKVFGDEGVPVLFKRVHRLPIHVTIFLQEKNVFFGSRMGFEHLGGCILVDGSLGSYTAALDQDYADAPGQRGYIYEKPRAFQKFVGEAHDAGVQLAFHAIGPRAIELVLDAYERALQRTPRHDHRHRIEHFELATDAQIMRAAQLGIIACMQPSFELLWGGAEGMYGARLGPAWRQTNRFRSILDAGMRIAGGSDTHVTPPNPLWAIHGAVNHPNEDERISVDEALRMMTLDAAYSGFTETFHGSISPGKHANFAVLDADPRAVPSEHIRDIRVVATYYKARRVFDGIDEIATELTPLAT